MSIHFLYNFSWHGGNSHRCLHSRQDIMVVARHDHDHEVLGLDDAVV